MAVQVPCDRDGLVDEGLPWPAAVRPPAEFDAVIDFSSYTRADTRSALAEFGPRIRFYLFISSDSVYEVCQPPILEPALTDKTQASGIGDGDWRLSTEEDARRPPKHSQLRRELRRADRYGHGKLVSEREVARSATRHGFRYLSLRLADVLGPRDNTGRWLGYVAWIIATAVIPAFPGVHLPAELQRRPISLVAAKDVAALIAAVVAGRLPDHTQPLDAAYNLAFNRPVLLRELLTAMAAAIGAEPRFSELGTGEEATTMLPSVERGPVATTLAQDRLGWTPTPLGEVIHESCRFYLEAIASGGSEAREAVADLVEDLGLTDLDPETVWRSVHSYAREKCVKRDTVSSACTRSDARSHEDWC